MSGNEWLFFYAIWFPVQAALGIAWFYSKDAFETGRPERPTLTRAIIAAYFVWAWVPFITSVLVD